MRKYFNLFWILIFIIVSVIPLFGMNTAKITEQENRTLAKFPELRKKDKLNMDFGKEFESWLGDRFWGRNQLIEARFQVLYKINDQIENDNAIMLSDGMIFNKEKIKRFCKGISEDQFNLIKSSLRRLRSWSEKNGIKLYVFLVPDKEDIFIEKIPNIPLNCKKNSASDFISKVKDEMDIDILYPRDLYQKKHKEFTHAHTDHHWTEYGAFLTYQELSKRIKKDFSNFATLSPLDFNIFYNEKPRLGNFKNLFDRNFYIGTNCYALGLSRGRCPLTHKYAYYNHKNKKKLKVDYGPIKMSRYMKYLNSKNDLKVVVLGRSHGGFLMPFLPYSVKEVLMLRLNNQERGVKNTYEIKRFEKYILNFKPDILLLYVSSINLNEFTKFYSKEE